MRYLPENRPIEEIESEFNSEIISSRLPLRQRPSFKGNYKKLVSRLKPHKKYFETWLML
jgi:hypothetical protein